MFLKIGVLKSFATFTGKHLGWSLFLIKFFPEHLFYLCYFSCFFFYFSLATLPLLPYSTVTFFVWRTTFVFMSLLLCMINITIANWFIRIAANATIYYTAISMIVKVLVLWCSLCWNKKKKPINKVQLKNILSFRRVISLIFQECLISLNPVLSSIKQTQTY